MYSEEMWVCIAVLFIRSNKLRKKYRFALHTDLLALIHSGENISLHCDLLPLVTSLHTRENVSWHSDLLPFINSGGNVSLQSDFLAETVNYRISVKTDFVQSLIFIL